MHQNKYDVKACSDTVVVKVGIHRACTEAYCSKHQSVWLSSSQVGRGVPEQNSCWPRGEENGEWRGNLLNCGIFPTEAQDTRPSRAPGGSPEGQNCHEDAKTLRLRWLHIEQTFPRVEESRRKTSAAAKKKKSGLCSTAEVGRRATRASGNPRQSFSLARACLRQALPGESKLAAKKYCHLPGSPPARLPTVPLLAHRRSRRRSNMCGSHL